MRESRASGAGTFTAACLIIAAVAVALLPAGARAAGKVPNEFLGIVLGGPTDDRDAQQMHAIGVRTMRVGLSWRATEPRQGLYRWPDTLVARLAENGIRPVFTVDHAPEWATGVPNPNSPPVTDEARRAWQEFLENAVLRYGPTGSFWTDHPNLPKQPVTAWQIWNEPNLPKAFDRNATGPPRLVKRAPRVYAKLVKDSDRAIGEITANAKVILAGVLGNPNRADQSKMAPERFLKEFLKVHNITKHFDAVGLHPYTPTIKKYKQVVAKIRKVMRERGAGGKSLWLDEVGWGSADDGFRLNKGQRGQANMLSKALEVTLENRKRWNVDHLYWFDWRDPDPSVADGCSFCDSAGLMRFDRTRKPSFREFKRFTEMQGKRARHRHHHHHHHGG